MAKQRYVIRLHRLVRQELDEHARKMGHLTPTLAAMAVEEMCRRSDAAGYEIHPDSEVFQLKRGNRAKGRPAAGADRQMSVYLSDRAYDQVGRIARRLQKEENKNITEAFVIRDMLLHWLDKGI